MNSIMLPVGQELAEQFMRFAHDLNWSFARCNADWFSLHDPEEYQLGWLWLHFQGVKSINYTV